MGRKKWRVADYDKELVTAVAAENGLDAFAALLLVTRGISDEADIKAFCSKKASFCDPFDLIDMDRAVQCINEALDCGEKIAVYGDYDADGVTATALLYSYLQSQGADVITYIPDRNLEGYGLNMDAVKKLHDAGVKLIITVDTGISTFAEADYIAELGMKLVVTDHHKTGSRLPAAAAVVDPHRSDCTCEFRQWAGVGVAFKLVCALEGDDGSALADDYADLVALGTIADIVPLTGENRALVRKGVRLINSSRNPGIAALREAAGMAQRQLSATNVAFSLVPRINAIGRMGNVESAFELLTGEGGLDVGEYAARLDASNSERQKTETEIMNQALAMLRSNPSLMYDRVIVLSAEGWHGGVIGIVAARLVERFGKPCIVITQDGEQAKGSGRSLEGFSLYDAINSASHLLTHFGGHPLAAGFGILSKDIDSFRILVNNYAKTVEMPYPVTNIDCRLRANFLSVELLDIFEMLEPFGAGNPQPVFGLFGMTLTAVQPVGGGKHLRLTFTKDNASVTAMRFGVTAEKFPYKCGDRLDLAVKLDKNEYRGETKLSVHIRDMRPSGSSDEAFLGGVRLFEKIMRNESVTAQQAASALPARDFCAKVYRTVKQSSGWHSELDALCLRLGDDGSCSCRLCTAIEAMVQLGILSRDGDGGIELADTDKKVSLDSAPLLVRLREASGQ